MKLRALAMMLLATGSIVGSSAPVDARPVSAVRPDAAMPEAEVERRVEVLLTQMTPAEKAGQLFMFTSFAPPPGIDPEVEKAVTAGQAGGFFLANDPERVNALQRLAVEKSRLGIPLLFGLDVIHGMRTIFPVPIGLAASWDMPLVEQVQAHIAAEARSGGIGWIFGPNVDIARDPRWGRMVEGPGEDPWLASALARAQVRGMQGPYLGAPGHVVSSPKHFAGYGAAIGGRDYDEVDLSDNLLWNVYLPPFKAAVDAGAGGIMSAYMPLNGVPAAANRWLLTDVLRKQWGFKGFVVSDAVSVTSLVTQGVAADKATAALRAFDAGMTMELGLPNGALGMTGPAAPGGSAFASLPAAVADGRLDSTSLDDAVRRILAVKVRLGLFENPYADPAAFAKQISDPSGRILATKAAVKSAVLLRNEGNILPLDPAKLTSLAVIGPLADSAVDTEGPWVFKPRAEGVTILEGLRAKLGKRVRIDYVEGARMPPRLNARLIDPPAKVEAPIDENAEIARAVAAANASDAAVIVVGEKLEMSGENASRATLDLPGRQQDLVDAVVATGKPVILLLMSGRPLDLKQSKAAAIMMIWYPGTQGGTAVADLLTGDAAPGGKLPFSWPRSVGQVPVIASALPSHDPSGAAKRYWDAVGGALWPFGYGLGYTQFTYSAPRVDLTSLRQGQAVNIGATVRNTGARTGDEVVQLYLHQHATVSRPVRELKGFQRITLKPGEAREVNFTLTPQDLSFWNPETRQWTEGDGSFDIWVGGDSTAGQAGSFTVAPRSMP